MKRIGLFVLILGLSAGTIWLRLFIMNTTLKIGQTDKMIRDLRQAKEQMELKVTGLRSPRRLEVLAKTKFGLGQPRSDQVIHYGRNLGNRRSN
jgi:hypothetical protein